MGRPLGGQVVPTLSDSRIAELLADYYPDPGPLLLAQLSVYLDLLVKWNARTNLTSIRGPEEMVRRHVGESLFASLHLPKANTLLGLRLGCRLSGVAHPAGPSGAPGHSCGVSEQKSKLPARGGSDLVPAYNGVGGSCGVASRLGSL